MVAPSSRNLGKEVAFIVQRRKLLPIFHDLQIVLKRMAYRLLEQSSMNRARVHCFLTITKGQTDVPRTIFTPCCGIRLFDHLLTWWWWCRGCNHNFRIGAILGQIVRMEVAPSSSTRWRNAVVMVKEYGCDVKVLP